MDTGDLLFSRGGFAKADRPRLEDQAVLIARAISAVSCDALTPGEKDLALGVEFYEGLVRKHKLPVVQANLVREAGNKPVFPPYLIRKVAGFKVALIGLMDENLMSSNADLFKGSKIKLVPALEAYQKAAKKAKEEGAQILVVLSHKGLDLEKRLRLSDPTPNFVLAGHSRRFTNTVEQVGSYFVMEAGYKGKHLGRLDMHVVDGDFKFSDAGAHDAIRDKLKTLDRRISSYRKYLEKNKDDPKKAKFISSYQSWLDKSTKERQEAIAQVEAMKNQKMDGDYLRWSLVKLDKRVPSDRQVDKLVKEFKTKYPDKAHSRPTGALKQMKMKPKALGKGIKTIPKKVFTPKKK